MTDDKSYEDLKKELENAKRFIKNLGKTNKRINQELKDRNLMIGTVGHDMRSPFATVNTGCQMLLLNETDPKKLYILEHLEKVSEEGIKSLGMMNLKNFSPETIKKNSQTINLLNFTTQQVNNYKMVLERKEKEKGFLLKYDLLSSKDPISIYSHQGYLYHFLDNLLQNSIKNAPKNSKIKMGQKINGNKLEMLLENQIGEKEMEIMGLGVGKGNEFIRQFLKTYNGKISEYSTPKIDNNEYASFKPITRINPEKEEYFSDKIFGVKVEIPMENLTKKE